jgi:hypothetical protein
VPTCSEPEPTPGLRVVLRHPETGTHEAHTTRLRAWSGSGGHRPLAIS